MQTDSVSVTVTHCRYLLASMANMLLPQPISFWAWSALIGRLWLASVWACSALIGQAQELIVEKCICYIGYLAGPAAVLRSVCECIGSGLLLPGKLVQLTIPVLTTPLWNYRLSFCPVHRRRNVSQKMGPHVCVVLWPSFCTRAASCCSHLTRVCVVLVLVILLLFAGNNSQNLSPPKLLFLARVWIKSFVGRAGFSPYPTGGAFSALETHSYYRLFGPGKGDEKKLGEGELWGEWKGQAVEKGGHCIL